jgi:serine/threonine protein kinase
MSSSTTASGHTRPAVALLIGIGTYQHSDRISALRYASRDARSLARSLTDPDLCAFPPEKVKVLTERRARRTEIAHHLSVWLPEQARGAELAVLYFAGHGIVEKVGDREEGYLLPHDVHPDNLAAGAIPMSDLARWIATLGAGAVVLCLDCCHAGTILSTGNGVQERAQERDLRLRPSVLQGMAGKGRFLIASCDAGQKSLEAEELQHGLFTYHLLKGLRGAGDRDGDGKVSVAELFNYVSTAVSKDAREKYQHEQTPWTSAVWNEEVVLSIPRRERRGAEVTLAPFSPSAGPLPEEETLIDFLRAARRRRDPVQIPLIFCSLAHQSADVRQRAQRALRAYGWDEITRSVEELARRADQEQLGWVLEGLAALEAHPDTVALLDRVELLLRGDVQQRAARLLAHKRLGLEKDRLVRAFRDRHIPYQIDKVLGPGTYTAAWLARVDLAGHEVVVRVLRPEFASRPAVRARFLELGRLAVPLVHQNLVLTREARAFADQDLYFTVRDYIAGATLREVLESGRRFDLPQILLLLRQVLEGLTPIHRGNRVHGGIRPSNLFVARDDRVIVGDPALPILEGGWDAARLAYDFRYAAPESFRPGISPDPMADFYSLGCVAHELLYGVPPFVSESPYELAARHERDPILLPTANSPIDIHLHFWLKRLLARSPAERFATLAEALGELERLEGLAQRPAEPATTPELDLSGAPAAPAAGAESVHLLDEASLASLEGGQSLVPLTKGPIDASQQPEQSAAPGGPPPMLVAGYEILEELGRGGMGVVYAARQVRLNRIVALKMILSGRHAGRQQTARFLREAEAVARLQHPNIVQIYELGQHEGWPFFALEYLSGGTLAERLQGSRLAPAEAAGLIAQLAGAVHHAHTQSVVHRDLKPSNVLFAADGTPRITDFGLAKKVDEDDGAQTRSGEVLGTPAYMAPEQAGGRSRDVGPATDVYALGAMLYECLTGQPPFKAATAIETIVQVMNADPVPPRQVDRAIPADLEVITLKCLAKDPAQRYASAAELGEDLHRFLQGQAITARPVGTMEQVWRWLRRQVGGGR